LLNDPAVDEDAEDSRHKIAALLTDLSPQNWTVGLLSGDLSRVIAILDGLASMASP
jgi:hypothetical protein